MEDKIVTLESYYNPMLAEITLARLEANGISCFIADNNILDANPFYNQAVGGVKIKVFEHDLEKCREILAQHVDVDLDEAAMAATETTCPYCNSTDVAHSTTDKATAWHCLSCQQDFE